MEHNTDTSKEYGCHKTGVLPEEIIAPQSEYMPPNEIALTTKQLIVKEVLCALILNRPSIGFGHSENNSILVRDAIDITNAFLKELKNI